MMISEYIQFANGVSSSNGFSRSWCALTWKMSTLIGRLLIDVLMAWMMSKSGVSIWKVGLRSVIRWWMSSITDLLSTGMGRAGVLPAVDGLLGYHQRRLSIHLSAAYRVAASGCFNAYWVYSALRGRSPPPVMSGAMSSFVVERIQA